MILLGFLSGGKGDRPVAQKSPVDTGDATRAQALHLAAQHMADAFRCRLGKGPQRLIDMDERNRAFYLQTARNVVSEHEAVMHESSVDVAITDEGIPLQDRIDCAAAIAVAVEKYGLQCVLRAARLEAAQQDIYIRLVTDLEASK